MTQQSTQKKILPDRPGIYLVYLAFLFLPWFFIAPKRIDIAVSIAATAVYLPLHFACFKAEGRRKFWMIGAISALGVLVAPFTLGYSVFHIYAASFTGFIRPTKTSAIILCLCMTVFVASGLVFDRYSLEIIVGLVISIVVWVSTFSEATIKAAHAQAERERTLEAQQASLVERERIARDLHDLLGHTLTLVSLKADLAERLIETDLDRAKAEIKNIQSSSRQALADVRKTLSGLTATSVKQELKNSQAALKAANIELGVKGQYPDLSTEHDTAMGLMIREAVTNIIRHSVATHVEIMFSHTDNIFAVSVTDNGTSQGMIEGNGLAGLRKRLEALGGILSVHEANGIQLKATLPA